jgi:hypothetical protein
MTHSLWIFVHNGTVEQMFLPNLKLYDILFMRTSVLILAVLVSQLIPWPKGIIDARNTDIGSWYGVREGNSLSQSHACCSVLVVDRLNTARHRGLARRVVSFDAALNASFRCLFLLGGV